MSEYRETFLAPAELAFVVDAGKLYTDLCAIIPDGPSRDNDLREACAHVHALQHMVMSQAAARAYPELYRELGGPR